MLKPEVEAGFGAIAGNERKHWAAPLSVNSASGILIARRPILLALEWVPSKVGATHVWEQGPWYRVSASLFPG